MKKNGVLPTTSRASWHVLSFDIAKLSQAIAQLRPEGFGIRIAQEKSADPTHFWASSHIVA
jgi:hypothetical protein